MKTEPLSGLVVAPEWAHAVISPPYDALDEEGRRRFLDDHPDSFLGALPLGVPDATDLVRCAQRVAEFRSSGQFRSPGGGPFAAVTRVVEGGVSITGVVVDVPIGEFGTAISGHERTRPARVDDLAAFLHTVRVASSPVTVAHPPSPTTTNLVHESVGLTPLLDSTADDGSSVTVWLVDPDEAVDALEPVETGIIIDGHHRTAAAVAAGSSSVVSAFVPSDGLGATGFDRVSQAEVVDAPKRIAAAGFTVEPLDGPERPGSSGRVHLGWEGAWYAISGWGESVVDAEVVDDRILRGALDITDFEVRPGIGPLPSAPLVIASHPPSWETLETMVGRGLTMPPKSTYFTPKMRSGVFLIDR